MTGDVQSARWIVLAILGRRMMVEKVHERTVRNKRHDSFRFNNSWILDRQSSKERLPVPNGAGRNHAIQPSGHAVERLITPVRSSMSSAGRDRD